MTVLSTTSNITKPNAPGGAFVELESDGKGVIAFHSSDCPKGEAEWDHQLKCTQAGGLERISSTILSVGRRPLTIGKTAAHRGMGRSVPILFQDLHRNTNGGVESGGSFRLGPISVN